MKVLFVCTGNSFRSVVAEALAEKYISDWDVESAGIDPASDVASNAKELLEEEGATELIKDKPEELSAEKFDNSDLIVTMEEEHAEYIKQNYEVEPDKIRVWNVSDPINPDVGSEEAFDDIKNNVLDLVDSI